MRACMRPRRRRSGSARSRLVRARPPRPSLPPVAQRVRHPAAAARAARHRAHLRRRAAPRRDAGRARRCSTAPACARPSTSSASRSSDDPALAAEIAAAGHEIGDPRLPPLAAPAPQPGRAPRRPRPRRARDRRGDRPRSRLSYRPPYGVFSLAGAPARPRALAGSRCSGRTGAATGRRGRRASRSPRARRAASAPATSCCCTTPTPTASAGSWRQTVAALPAVLDAAARDRRAARARPSQST